MVRRLEYIYDVFISYSPADREWVAEWLLPRLEQAGLRVAIDYRDFTVGMPRIVNTEQALENSRRTIVVLSPDWLDSEWNAFHALLLRTTDPAARQRKLLPVLLSPCELPESIDALEKVDLTVESHWEAQLKRLTRDIQDVIPVRPPWREGGVRDFTQWKRWLRRYRRELLRGLAALIAVWLIVFMALQLPPFQRRQVWRSLSVRAPNALDLLRAGDVLLVAGANVELGCEHLEQGLWRSADGGTTWKAIHAPLCFDRSGQGRVLADVVGLAQASVQPTRIYAATSDVGLLRSDDGGQTWARTGDIGLESKQLKQVAVDPDDADRVFVVPQTEGLYRSTDGGQRWKRLDRQQSEIPACPQGTSLTKTLTVGALLSLSGELVVGTYNPLALTDVHVPSGLYVSTDGGDCWDMVDDGEGRLQYVALAHASSRPGRPILVLARDWWLEPGSGTWRLWRLDLASSQFERQLLWTHDHTVGSLIVQEGVNPIWYAATALGEVVRGSLDVPAQVEKLPRLTRCMLPPTCDVDLADLGEDLPMLLAGGQVYQLEEGPWWKRIWP